MLEIYRDSEKLISRLPDDLAKAYETYNTPAFLQWFISTQVKYNMSENVVSAYQGFLDKAMDCDSGSRFAAIGLATQGIKPWNIFLVANKHDLHHNIIAYQAPKTELWGSVAKSRDPEIEGRPAVYKSYIGLACSYYPYYLSSFKGYEGELTMIGFSEPIDLLAVATSEALLGLGEDNKYVMSLHNNFLNNVDWFNIHDGLQRRLLFDENDDVIL